METSLENVELDVIIVGGGMAGIAAAQQLLQNGVNNILVLEAQDYLGGRIKTIDTEYGHIDLGAEWIHGQTGNPLYDIAVENRLVHNRNQSSYISPSSASIYDVHEFRTENGSLINRNIVCQVSKAMEDLYCESINSAPKECQQNTDIISEIEPFKFDKAISRNFMTKSFATHYSEGFDEYLESCENEDYDIQKALYKWRLKWELGDNCCASLDDVAFPGRYIMYEGHGITDLKFGFGSVFDVLKKDIPKQKVALRKPVKVIKWKKRNICYVECFDGSVYKSKHVIVTVPIGYLKDHTTSMFCPSLPDEKVHAIQNVGFSTLVKVFLAWNKPFWCESYSGVQFVWSSDAKQEQLKTEISKQGTRTMLKVDGNPWYLDITGFERCTGRPNVLCGWLVGEGAELSTTLSDIDVSKVCTRLLQCFCGDEAIPEPDNIYRSQWQSNQFIGGGYSYVSTRTQDGDFEALCQSLPSNQNPRLLFAGEATSYNFYSTAHGAYETGIRAARTIITLKQESKETIINL
ncbi:spermine oxidase-like isoform X2 [Mytilus galloprovincialis]